ncbi:site-2 protease family protein [Streptomyces sp. NPDC057217]|uniref:site-2 protease family protein n=1 Tax=Streptomyces sp. NPDC057217 TaxID=3346054 RepID=UPI00363124FE
MPRGGRPPGEPAAGRGVRLPHRPGGRGIRARAVGRSLAWLAGINLLLAVFNALSAVPLDGGRLLRVLVWRWTGDRLRATAVTTGSGRLLGWALVALGLLLLCEGYRSAACGSSSSADSSSPWPPRKEARRAWSSC